VKDNELKKKRVTLYFTEDSSLTDVDVAAMNSVPGGAFHRNASLVDVEAKLEPCDAVCGPAVPAQYAEAFPTVEIDYEAIEAELAAGEEADGAEGDAKPKRRTRSKK
jgi:hypothetical protein